MPDVAIMTSTQDQRFSPQASESQQPSIQTSHPMSISLYVGDLSSDVTEAMLFEIFNSVASVASLRVCRDIHSRRSLGYAYVNFYTSNDAERALQTLNHYVVKGKPIRVMWSQRDPSIRKSGLGNVYIKNLESDIDTKSLYEALTPFGNILSCKVVPNGDSNFGFIHFETEESSKLAIEKLNGKLLNGVKVYVGPFIPKKMRMKDQDSLEPTFTNVFIKNLPESWDTEKLEKFFSKFGKISCSTVMQNESGISRQFGFVNFLDPKNAMCAVEKVNGTIEEGKKLFVGRAMKKQERMQELKKIYLQVKQELNLKSQGCNLYIKNLSDSVDEVKIKELFSNYGTITSARIMYDEKNIHKGFGFVCFSNSEEASKALAATNNILIYDGKPIYVAIAQPKEVRREQLATQYLSRINSSIRFHPVMAQHSAPNSMYYPANIGQPRTGMMFHNVQGRRFIRPNNSYYMSQPVSTGQRHPRPIKKPQGNAGMMNRPTMVHQQRPTMHNSMELNSTMLSEASETEQKEIIGNKLYHMILPTHGELAPKITGMLLEMDIAELLHLVESSNSLMQKVEEAVVAIEESRNKQREQ